MEGEATVIVVSVGESPTALLEQLQTLGLRVIEADFHDAEEQIEETRPELVLLSGARGATELSTLLEDQEGEHPPKMVVAAERRELSRLYGLNRDIVISLLATEMNEKVVAKRVAAVARQLARKRGNDASPPSSQTSAANAAAFLSPTSSVETGPKPAGDRTAGSRGPSPAPQVTGLDRTPRTAEHRDEPTSGSASSQSEATTVGPQAKTDEPASAASKSKLPDLQVKPRAPQPSLGSRPRAATPPDLGSKPHAAKPDLGSKPKPDLRSKPKPDLGSKPKPDLRSKPHAAKPDLGSPAASSTPKSQPRASTAETFDEGATEKEAETAAFRRERVSRPGDDPARFLADIDAATEALEALDGESKASTEKAEAVEKGAPGDESPAQPGPADALDSDEPFSQDLARERQDDGPGNRSELQGAPPAPVSLAPDLVESLRPSDAASEPPSEPPSEPEPFHPPPPDGLPTELGPARAPSHSEGQRISHGTLRPDARRQDSVHSLEVGKPEPRRTSKGLFALAGLVVLGGIGLAASQGAFDQSGSKSPASLPPPVGDDTTATQPSTPDPQPPAAETEKEPGAESRASDKVDPTGTGDDDSPVANDPLKVEDQNLPGCDQLTQGFSPETNDPVHEASLHWRDARELIVKGDLKRANVLMCQAVAINPESPALEGLAHLYSTRRSPVEAMKWVEKALELRPDDRDTINLKGDILSQLGQNEEAVETWLAAMSVAPDATTLRSGLAKNYLSEGRKYLKMGNYPRAERMLRRAIGMDPNNVFAPTALAEVFYATERLERAAIFAQRALTLNEYDPQAHVLLGNVAEAKGNKEEARKHYERALEVRSDFWPAKRALAELATP